MLPFMVFQVLGVLPAVVAAALLLYVLIARRTTTDRRAAIALLGASMLCLWLIAQVIGRVGTGLAARGISGEITAAQSALLNATAYLPFVLIGILVGLAPVQFGSAASAIGSGRFRSAAQTDAAIAVWVPGLRWFGIYLAAYAALMTLWNSGLLQFV